MDIVATLKREEVKLLKRLTGIQGAIKALVGVNGNGNSNRARDVACLPLGRARIAAAQRKRWAKIKNGKKA